MHQDDTAAIAPDPNPPQSPAAGSSALAAAVGAAGAMLASGLMLWAARAWDGVHLAQLLSERLTEIVPLEVFRDALTRLESSAKPLTLAGLIALQVVAGALVAIAYGRLRDRLRLGRATGAIALLVLAWAALSLVIAPLSGINVLGRDAAGGLGRAHGTFILVAAAYALVVAAFVPWPRVAPVASDPSRRRLLRTAGASLLVVPTAVSAGYITRFVRSLDRSPGSGSGSSAFSQSPFAFPGMPPAITPNHEFYVVSKNFIDPDVDETSWSVEVAGLVDKPVTLTYADVLDRPASEMTSTLECISNPVGGEYISTARWKGFPLRDLLVEAGLRPGVVDIALHAADDYVDTIPVEEALAADTMLVHTMNDEPLPVLHGFPLRLIVPGIFGMKNVKWITRIEAIGEDLLGYWQQREWDDHAPVLTMSRIDTPRDGQRVPLGTERQIGGVAFAGDRGISKVEVSLDDGATWQECELSEPLSPLTWRLWKLPFAAAEAGTVSVTVRATDGAGELQTSEERDILPSGATGWHRLSFEVTAS